MWVRPIGHFTLWSHWGLAQPCLSQVSDAAGLLKVPGDRYKPTSLGRKKSSFLVTEEDLGERGESVEPYSESVQSYPLS